MLLTRFALTLMLSAAVVVPAFAAPADTAPADDTGIEAVSEEASAELDRLVATLAEDDHWDGARVGYGGVRTDRRAAWERLTTLATVAELVALATDHPSAGVRYGAVRSLVDRGAEGELPAWVKADDAQVTTCPGGCICGSDTVGDYLRRVAAGDVGLR